MQKLARARLKFAQSPIGRAIRAAGLHRLLDAPYEAMLRARGPVSIPFRDRRVRFRVTSKQESAFLADHWEMRAVETLCDLLEPGDVIWDIGANIGLYACCLGVARPDDVTIHAFEPDPTNAARLAENVRLNELPRVSVHQVALSDERGEAEFFVDGHAAGVTSSLIGGHFDHDQRGDRSVRVQTYAAEGFAADMGAQAPTIVKCDVEGAEGAVLRGMSGWLDEKRIRRLEVELHRDTLAKLGSSVEEVERFVLDKGYECIERTERSGGSRPILATYRPIA